MWKFRVRTAQGVSWERLLGYGGLLGDGVLYTRDRERTGQQLLARSRRMLRRGELYTESGRLVREVLGVR